MNVSLTPTLEAFVQAKVATGLYNNASEVIREALRLLEENDRIKALKMEILKKEVSLAIESLDRGEYSSKSVGEIADQILSMYQAE
ncbi:MAG: type II toxin-antitoxin system ParD family antitoxin [Bacteroidota bacterium]